MIARLHFALFAVATMALTHAVIVRADPAPFDLTGPVLEARVTRAQQTLPIAEVPNLAAGDRLWIKADLPSSQSEHYLLILAFLRGSTNPPPSDWFFRCETWKRKCARDGMTVVVPQEARQVLVFLAPQTNGDFETLVDSVRGRPGAFVRTSQDLNQATLDRSRLESYLSAVWALNQVGAEQLKEATPLLARSLAIKVDEKCLQKIPELQAPCLMDGQESLILNDGHSTSIVQALTSGPANDLAMEASYTPQLSYGYYSPYVASVLDIARIFDSFRIAHYQYIPALASLENDRLALTLNSPPSFHDPKSVLVTALPAVENVQMPPLHSIKPQDIYCARNPSLILPVEGAPLVFSTEYAHDLTLQLTATGGTTFELPVAPEARRGGLVIDTSSLSAAALGGPLRASLHGRWGFDHYDGPRFQLVDSRAQSWKLAAEDSEKFVVGRENTVHLQADSVSCIDHLTASDQSGKELKVEWKPLSSNEVALNIALHEAAPGPLTLWVTQYGLHQPQTIPLQAFSEPGHLDSFTIHAGDSQATLEGSRLDEVAAVVVKGIAFVSGKLSSTQGRDELTMVTQDPQVVGALKPGEPIKAKVTLKDGRLLDFKTAVEAPRPAVTLIAKSVRPSDVSGKSNLQLTNPDELPQDATLTFSLRTVYPSRFTQNETVQVATLDEAFSTNLSFANGAITLQNRAVAVATLDPAKTFGSSAFGPLQFRVGINGVQSDWQPLATLVRLPLLVDLSCPVTTDLACKLSGVNLFLLDSISGEAQFGHPVQVPDGFPGYALPVPHPTDGRLYVKLRDDPSVVNTASLAARQLPPPPEEAAREAPGETCVSQMDGQSAMRSCAPAGTQESAPTKVVLQLSSGTAPVPRTLPDAHRPPIVEPASTGATISPGAPATGSPAPQSESASKSPGIVATHESGDALQRPDVTAGSQQFTDGTHPAGRQ